MADPLVLSNNVARVHIVTFGRTVDPRRRLDVAGANPDDGTSIIQWDATDGPNQRFVVLPGGTTDHPGAKLIATFSGRVLDIDNNGGAGSKVWAWEVNYSDAQRWVLEPQTDGSVIIASAANPDLVLDVGGADQAAGAGLIVWHRNGQVNQRYRLETA